MTLTVRPQNFITKKLSQKLVSLFFLSLSFDHYFQLIYDLILITKSCIKK
jgi:hypothetical protein